MVVCYYLFDHANRETFLEAAELTTIASSFVDRTVPVSQANIFRSFLHRSLEKPFAAFTSSNAIMLASGVIPADGTQLRWRFRSTGRIRTPSNVVGVASLGSLEALRIIDNMASY